MWFALALVAGSLFISSVLRPKPRIENARAATLDEFSFPRSSEGDPVPLVFGVVKIRSPNTLWYGDFKAVPRTKLVRTGTFSKEEQIIGHTYGIGIALGLFLGAWGRLYKIYIDDKILWEGAKNIKDSGETFRIFKFEFFEPGDAVCNVRFYPGHFDPAEQPIDPYLQKKNPDTPAYRGLSYVVFENFAIGYEPRLRNIQFEVGCLHDGIGLGTKVIITDEYKDYCNNPAGVLYEILYYKWSCLNLPQSAIDIDSFRKAGETLYDEKNGMSLIISKTIDAKTIIKEVLRQTNGILYQDPASGKLVYKLIRNDYDQNDLPLFDDKNITKVISYNVTSWSETVNQVRVSYEDRHNNYTKSIAVAQDDANYNLQGAYKTITVEYPGVKTARLANKVAATELSYVSVPTCTITFETNYSGSILNPGDPIRVHYLENFAEVFRVQQIQIGPKSVRIEAVKDKFAADVPVIADPFKLYLGPVNLSAKPPKYNTVIGTPYYFINSLDFSIMALASPANEDQLNFSMEVSQLKKGATKPYTEQDFTTATTERVEWCPVGVVSEVDNNSITLEAGSNIIFSNVLTNDIRRGRNLLLKGAEKPLYDSTDHSSLFPSNELEEFLSYENYETLDDGRIKLTKLHRGLLDTTWSVISKGDIIWSLSNSEGWTFKSIRVPEEEGFNVGDTTTSKLITCQFVSYTSGEYIKTDDIKTIWSTPRSRLPYPPFDVRINGQSIDNDVVRATDIFPIASPNIPDIPGRIIIPPKGFLTVEFKERSAFDINQDIVLSGDPAQKSLEDLEYYILLWGHESNALPTPLDATLRLTDKDLIPISGGFKFKYDANKLLGPPGRYIRVLCFMLQTKLKSKSGIIYTSEKSITARLKVRNY